MLKVKLLSLLFILSFPIFSKDKVDVFTSILPQKYFVERIGGNRVNCKVLVGPGKSPATYNPKPSQVIHLGNADVLFTTGVPFEKSFIGKIEESLSELKIVDISTGIAKREIDDHDHHDDEHHDDEHHDDEHHDDEHHNDEHHDDEHHNDEHHDDEHHDDEHHDDEHHDDEHHDDEHHDHGEGDLDPHVWLSPVLAKTQAENIYNTLVELDPESKNYYKKRLDSLIKDLDKVHQELKSKLAPYKGKILFVYHPSFGYFADEYGLKQEAIETGGKEPTPKQLNSLIEEAKEEGVKVIAVQPEFSKKSAKVIAKAIDGKVIVLNPLNPDYINNLKEIAEVIITAYK